MNYVYSIVALTAGKRECGPPLTLVGEVLLWKCLIREPLAAQFQAIQIFESIYAIHLPAAFTRTVPDTEIELFELYYGFRWLKRSQQNHRYISHAADAGASWSGHLKKAIFYADFFSQYLSFSRVLTVQASSIKSTNLIFIIISIQNFSDRRGIGILNSLNNARFTFRRYFSTSIVIDQVFNATTNAEQTRPANTYDKWRHPSWQSYNYVLNTQFCQVSDFGRSTRAAI
jgi:hypothetical protein